MWELRRCVPGKSSSSERRNRKSLGWFFKPSFSDEHRICARVFAVISGLVHTAEPAPGCPRCRAPMQVKADRHKPFGWRYRCVARLSERRRRRTALSRCRTSVSPTTNTWFQDCRDVGVALYLTFMWSCRVPVRQAIRDSGAGPITAVDYYNMCREVAEVVMTNEIKEHPLGGEGQYIVLCVCAKNE